MHRHRTRLREAERAAGPAGATVLLISDGQANRGMTDPERLGGIAADALGRGVTTTTLGIGMGYDEYLLAALARGGRGNHELAETAEDALRFITAEAEGVLSQAAKATSLLLRPAPAVTEIAPLNDLPVTTTPDGISIELGSLYLQETRTLTFVLGVKPAPERGPLRLATAEMSWDELPGLTRRTAAAALDAEVVAPQAAAERTRDPRVAAELVFQNAQQAKRRASEALRSHDAAAALDHLRTAREDVEFAAQSAPAEMAAELAEELAVLAALIDDAASGRHERASKRSQQEYSSKNRNRGRRAPAAGRSVGPEGPFRGAKQPRRAWIDLSEAIRTLPLSSAEREPLAAALAALLHGRPDFHAGRFIHHAVSTDPDGAWSYSEDSLF